MMPNATPNTPGRPKASRRFPSNANARPRRSARTADRWRAGSPNYRLPNASFAPDADADADVAPIVNANVVENAVNEARQTDTDKVSEKEGWYCLKATGTPKRKLTREPFQGRGAALEKIQAFRRANDYDGEILLIGPFEARSAARKIDLEALNDLPDGVEISAQVPMKESNAA